MIQVYRPCVNIKGLARSALIESVDDQKVHKNKT